MVDKYFAETFLKGTASQVGMSMPALIQCDNGKKYYVKTDIVNGISQDAVLFQELLCSLIANYLCVPIPNFAIIELEQEFIENNAELRFGSRFKAGFYFATEEIENVEDNLVDNYHKAIQNGMPRVIKTWNSIFSKISNKNDFPKIIAFDLFIFNFDRYVNEGNIILSLENGSRTIYAIDHGHSFGNPFFSEQITSQLKMTSKATLLGLNDFPSNDQAQLNRYLNWHLGELSKGKLNLGTIFSALEQNIDLTDCNPFNEIINVIESISDDELISMMDEIPDQWIIGGDIQKNMYLNFLQRQKYLIRHLIDKMAIMSAFSNHRGGALVWETSAGDIQHGTQL